MKRVLIVLFLVIGLAAGIWLWCFDEYRKLVTAARIAETNGDVSHMASLLADYDDSFKSRFLAEVPLLERRVRSIRALIAIHQGDEVTSAESFAGVVTGGDDSLSAEALYNRGNLMVARSQLEAAKESYMRSLRIDDADMQAKINLELLLQEIKRQQQGRKAKDLLAKRRSLRDFWLRRETEGTPGGESSKRIWR